MHRLLQRQIGRILKIAPEDLPRWLESLASDARRPDAPEGLALLPDLLERISETYAQHDRDQDLLRRSLSLSSEELTAANQRLRQDAQTAAKAVASLRNAFNVLFQDGPQDDMARSASDLADLAEKLLLITREREEMRLALGRSEARFELAMRGANDGLWDWDLVSDRVYFSPRWKEMIGYGPDELGDTAAEWSSRLHPDDRAEAETAVREYLGGLRDKFDVTFRFRHRDGHYLWMLSRATLARDANGHIARMVGTHTDISARVELEHRLTQFKNALDEHAIVSISDAAGSIIYANDKFCEISGYAREELLGQNHRIVKSGQHPPGFYADIWHTITQGRVWRGEICNRARNGELYWVLATIAPMLDDNGVPYQYIGIRADITQNKRTEEALRQAKEAAEAASQAKSEFLANVSHEIRTPMNGVLGMLDLALATPLRDDQREYLHLAHHSADALLDIINDILDFSRIEAGHVEIHPEPFPLPRLLEDIAQLLRPRCRDKGLSLTVELHPGLPKQVVGDPVRLRQVLINLLGNAVKFTEKGGVTLSARPTPDGAIDIAVRDTGIGIPAEKQAAVFEAFTQADGSITRRFGGTGLGLTISSRLARLMGGEIRLRSQPGQGSEFTCRLPLPPVADSPVTPSPAPADTPPAPGTGETGGLTVLLAEDNLINQKLAVTLLTKAGHAPHTVVSGREAVEAADQRTFDVALMDMQMPDMDGLEATRLIREREARLGLPRLPIIALTANAFESDRQKCLDAGMDDFISKPLRREELLAALARNARRSGNTSTTTTDAEESRADDRLG